MQLKLIGGFGIDGIEIGGFANPPHPAEIKALRNPVSCNNISISTSPCKCTIIFHNIDTTVVFKINNKDKRPYTSMKIRCLSSESNLVPMTMDYIRTCIIRACRMLKELFNINLKYSSRLKVNYIKISKIIKLDYNDAAYRHIIKMFADTLLNSNEKAMEIYQKDLSRFLTNESEKFDSSMIGTRLYDKRCEMADKNKSMTDHALLCLEYVLSTEASVIDNLGTNLVVAVDDSKIVDYFLRRTMQLFDQLVALNVYNYKNAYTYHGLLEPVYDDILCNQRYCEIYNKFMNICYYDTVELY
jgi:hypothetical protein